MIDPKVKALSACRLTLLCSVVMVLLTLACLAAHGYCATARVLAQYEQHEAADMSAVTVISIFIR